jgi:hypothetical protein
MDTAKPRTLAEVIARSVYFADLKPVVRLRLSRIADHAVRWLWGRTGAGEGTLRRTHAESLTFLNKHPRLLECVKFMYETNDGNKNLIKRYMSVGYASAMLYLMGCSATESDRGENSGYIYNSCEDEVVWDNWDKAEKFWTLLAGGHDSMKAIQPAMASLVEYGLHGDPWCQCSVLVKAWNLYVDGEKLTEDELALDIMEDDDGIMRLGELPNVGGIDIGKQ